MTEYTPHNPDDKRRLTPAELAKEARQELAHNKKHNDPEKTARFLKRSGWIMEVVGMASFGTPVGNVLVVFGTAALGGSVVIPPLDRKFMQWQERILLETARGYEAQDLLENGSQWLEADHPFDQDDHNTDEFPDNC